MALDIHGVSTGNTGGLQNGGYILKWVSPGGTIWGIWVREAPGTVDGGQTWESPMGPRQGGGEALTCPAMWDTV